MALLGVIPSHSVSAASPGMPSARWIVPKNPKAVVVVIHGGSWWGNDPRLVDAMVPWAQTFSNRANAVTMNIDYDPGVNSLPQVIQSYDLAKSKFPNLPICVAGGSAGGNLAMLLATHRRPNCVISEAGPTDISTTDASVKNSAAFLLGEANFRAWSPLFVTGRINTPTLLVSATNDPYVPHTTQAVPYKKRYPAATLVTLTPGDQKGQFIHSQVGSQQLANARTREVNLVLNVAKQFRAAQRK